MKSDSENHRKKQSVCGDVEIKVCEAVEQDGHNTSYTPESYNSFEITFAKEKGARRASQYYKDGCEENERGGKSHVSGELEVIVVRVIYKLGEECGLPACVGDRESAETCAEPWVMLNEWKSVVPDRYAARSVGRVFVSDALKSRNDRAGADPKSEANTQNDKHRGQQGTRASVKSGNCDQSKNDENGRGRGQDTHPRARENEGGAEYHRNAQPQDQPLET